MDLNTIIKKYENSNPKMDFLLWFTENYKTIKETQTKALSIADVSNHVNCVGCGAELNESDKIGGGNCCDECWVSN